MDNKNTMIELPTELEALNKGGRLDKIIANAKSGRYHDYKNPNDVICGKMELVKDLQDFPEAESIRQAVMAGDYDEKPDFEDLEMLRRDTPKSMWKMLGYNI